MSTRRSYWDPKSYSVTFGWAEELEGSGHVPDLPGTGRFHLQVATPGPWRYPTALCGKLFSWGRALTDEARDHKCHECVRLEKDRSRPE